MRRLFQQFDEKPCLLILFCGLVSFLFLLLVSLSTSPLNNYFDYDSSFYLVIGKGICRGLLSYRDLYDQKGPLVFYLNALGYLLTGNRTGVLLVQGFSMTLSVFMLYRLAGSL